MSSGDGQSVCCLLGLGQGAGSTKLIVTLREVGTRVGGEVGQTKGSEEKGPSQSILT